MASSSLLARVGLVTAVSVILGISTLSPLLKPASDFGLPPIGGPPLYQTASVADPVAAEQRAATDVLGTPAKRAATSVALLSFPPKPAAPAATAIAPANAAQQPGPVAAAAEDASELPPPIVAETETAPEPEKRAAAPRQSKKTRSRPPPIYTREMQMSIH
jgi:hypothetical protein